VFFLFNRTTIQVFVTYLLTHLLLFGLSRNYQLAPNSTVHYSGYESAQLDRSKRQTYPIHSPKYRPNPISILYPPPLLLISKHSHSLRFRTNISLRISYSPCVLHVQRILSSLTQMPSQHSHELLSSWLRHIPTIKLRTSKVRFPAVTKGFLSPKTSRPAPGPTQPHSQRVQGVIFPGGKANAA